MKWKLLSNLATGRMSLCYEFILMQTNAWVRMHAFKHVEP